MTAYDVMYEQLLEMNRAAFEAGGYEVAFHTLSSAIHCARYLSDEQRLADVERIATEQGEWIDAHAPTHAISSNSAAERGNQGVFANLALQARSSQLILRQDELKERISDLLDRNPGPEQPSSSITDP
jgi:hypothetical protein